MLAWRLSHHFLMNLSLITIMRLREAIYCIICISCRYWNMRASLHRFFFFLSADVFCDFPAINVIVDVAYSMNLRLYWVAGCIVAIHLCSQHGRKYLLIRLFSNPTCSYRPNSHISFIYFLHSRVASGSSYRSNKLSIHVYFQVRRQPGNCS